MILPKLNEDWKKKKEKKGMNIHSKAEDSFPFFVVCSTMIRIGEVSYLLASTSTCRPILLCIR